MAEYTTYVCDLCKTEQQGRENQTARFSLQNRFGDKSKEEQGRPSIYGDVCEMCETVIRGTLKKLKKEEEKKS